MSYGKLAIYDLQFTMHERLAISDVAPHCPLLIANSLPIANCQLSIASSEGIA